MASRIVCCRAGRSRAPPVSSGRRRSSRASSAAGGRTLTRAAASSIASGSPSSRRQIAATAGAFSGVRAKSGRTACARSTNSRTAADAATSSTAVARPSSASASGGTACSRSPETRSRTRLVTSTFSPGQAAEQVGHERRRLDHLLEVVQHQQGALVAQERRQPPVERLVAGLAHAEGLGDGGGDQVGVGDRGEGDEPDAVRERVGNRRGDLEGEAGLADAAGAGQRQQADVRLGAGGRTAATSRSRPTRGVSGTGRLPRWPGGGWRP